MSNIYAALEIGTTRTVLAIGEAVIGGRLKMTHAEIPSSGVRKSQILDITQVSQSIRTVLRKNETAQRAGGTAMTIGNAYLVVSGQHIRSDPFQGSVQVGGSKVSAEDINAAISASRKMPLPRERELIDIAEQAYGLDSLSDIPDPRGMSGRILRLDTLQISADADRINDARTAASDAHLEIRDPLFAACCAADVVLGEHERRNGALVLDIGGGSTGFAAYCDGYLVHAGVLGVGGDHVSNDIATAFQTTHAQAEELKIHEANAIIGTNDGESARVKVPGSSALMESRTISRRALDTVVNARLRELFHIVREKLEDQDLVHRLHAGVFLTGGGAAMRGIDALIQRELGMPVRTGVPIHVDGLADEPNPEAFAAVAGALLYAHNNNEDRPLFGGIFGRIFK